ncbi:MAG TPA: helix-turn-helix transcriptional regulator [Solirubrobacterales bacterium]|jgi:transcriptional regulator with XRE-family HTH domain|nr:helix-turn-helix transcriptional regulator [Solirubrobacterales bacterium]
MSDHAGEDARGLAALGTAIQTLRLQAGLSEHELAARAELPPQSLTAIEAGQEEPTWGDLRRIAGGLEASLESLLELAESLEDAGRGPST